MTDIRLRQPRWFEWHLTSVASVPSSSVLYFSSAWPFSIVDWIQVSRLDLTRGAAVGNSRYQYRYRQPEGLWFAVRAFLSPDEW